MDERAKYKQADRDKMAKNGQAMSDGSYPIADAEDLQNAIHAVGRGGADHDSIRKHIIARAKALGLSSKIPDNWNSDGSLKQTNGYGMDVETRKARADRMNGREARTAGGDGFEMRESGDGLIHLTGFASVTETAYDMGWYHETIARGAFAQTLSRHPDVQLLVNHAGLPLARTSAGSLVLEERDRGLWVDAGMSPDDPDVQTLRTKAGAGLVDQMSFAFSGAKSEWDEDYTTRRIVGLDIHRGDVSVVNQGANPATSFSMRSQILRLIDNPTDEALAELRELLPEIQRVLAVEAPTPEPPVEDDRRSLDWYRARAYQLARH